LLQLTDLPKGNYWLVLQDGGANQTRKLIIE
jgi:hypothetical protein